MRKTVCFYFQVHQPFRLRKDYGFFQIGPDHYYEDSESNRAIMERIAESCYLPANRILLEQIKKLKGKFKVAFSISGMALEQFELYAPEVIDSFRELVDTGCVELLGESYYHSLAFLKSRGEFDVQVLKHRQKIKELFGVTPSVFRNTELIYNNDMASIASELGFKAVLCEGADRILSGRSANMLYRSQKDEVKLLLKNYKLSDDIAFRFSNKDLKSYPLTPRKFRRWIKKEEGEMVNLFMDYETFGEHQKKENGIFKFLEKLPKTLSKKFDLLTPSEVLNKHQSVGNIDCPDYCSWADEERDLSAWIGNPLQDSALEYIYSLEESVKSHGDEELLHTWRKLQSSDHFYYACTKWKADGDVHSYFSPFESPHDAYVIYSNVVNDLSLTVGRKREVS